MDKSDWKLVGYLVFNHTLAVVIGYMVFTVLAYMFGMGLGALFAALVVTRLWPND